MQDDTSQLSAALERADAAFRSKIDELSFVSCVGEAISRHTSTRELSEELVEVIAETTLSKHATLYRRSHETRFYGRGCQEKHVPAERTTVPNTVVAASPCLR